MGFVSLTSACAVCGELIYFYNPLRVPSVRINGSREPICFPCVTMVNRHRAARGLPPCPIADDAYDAVDEQEVPWPED
jgi:hypothetical protein